MKEKLIELESLRSELTIRKHTLEQKRARIYRETGVRRENITSTLQFRQANSCKKLIVDRRQTSAMGRKKIREETACQCNVSTLGPLLAKLRWQVSNHLYGPNRPTSNPQRRNISRSTIRTYIQEITSTLGRRSIRQRSSMAGKDLDSQRELMLKRKHRQFALLRQFVGAKLRTQIRLLMTNEAINRLVNLSNAIREDFLAGTAVRMNVVAMLEQAAFEFQPALVVPAFQLLQEQELYEKHEELKRTRAERLGHQNSCAAAQNDLILARRVQARLDHLEREVLRVFDLIKDARSRRSSLQRRFLELHGRPTTSADNPNDLWLLQAKKLAATLELKHEYLSFGPTYENREELIRSCAVAAGNDLLCQKVLTALDNDKLDLLRRSMQTIRTMEDAAGQLKRSLVNAEWIPVHVALTQHVMLHNWTICFQRPILPAPDSPRK